MRTKTFLMLFGPNLNRVKKRNPALYGSLSLTQLEEAVRESLRDIPAEIELRQSNSEGPLIDIIQEHADRVAGIVFNPGALFHDMTP